MNNHRAINEETASSIDLDDFDDICLSVEAVNISGEDPGSQKPSAIPRNDTVSEEPVKRLHAKRENPGKDSPYFARHREAVRAASKVKLLDFIRALARGCNIREASEAAGCSYSWGRQHLWPEAKRLALAEWSAPEEKERLANLIMESLETVLKTALSRMTEHAAYGAVAISAAKELRDTMGIDFRAKQTGDEVTTDLEVLGEQIREAMPALMDHHEHLARIKMRQLENRALQEAQQAMPK